MRKSSKNSSRIIGAVVFALVLALTSAACGPQDPQEKVADLRSYYKADLNGFLILGPPAPDPLAVEPLMDEVPLAGSTVEPTGEEEAETPAEPVPESIQLDILLRHRSPERLPGITIDISMADGQGAEKGHWLVWYDTADIAKATVTQFTHVLENVSYEEGDGFFVEIRHPVPAEERGEYKEFPSTP